MVDRESKAWKAAYDALGDLPPDTSSCVEVIFIGGLGEGFHGNHPKGFIINSNMLVSCEHYLQEDGSSGIFGPGHYDVVDGKPILRKYE